MAWQSVQAASTDILVNNQDEIKSVTGEIAMSPTSEQTLRHHVVQAGETVSGIAESYGLRADTVLWTNNITLDDPIQPGDELIILPVNGLLYTVDAGDTIQMITNRFDADVKTVMALNGLTDTDLAVGAELIIPRAFAFGSYLTARGGAEETETDSSAAEVQVTEVVIGEDEPEIEDVAESRTEDKAPVERGGWAHPAPGTVLTQGAHGSGGVDFGGPVGTTVVAADSGTVTKAATGYNGGFGTVVEIDHADGTTSRYAHLSTLLVSSGDYVASGQAIGYIGMTGKTTGPHLHFEVHGGSNPFASCGYLSSCGG